MDFIREHRQLLLNSVLVVAFAVVMVLCVYTKAVPAEQQAETTPAVQVAEVPPVEATNSEGRSSYDNCLALQELELVDWDNDGVVRPERLETVANNAEGLAFALRLQNLETEVFAHKYDPPQGMDYPEWSKHYIGYAVHENLVPEDFAARDDLDGKQYIDWMVEALKKQNFDAAAGDFSQYLDGSLTYADLGDLTYQVLSCTKEEDGKQVAFADWLIAENIIAEKEAVMADLPVNENTEDNYKELFVEALETKSEAFVYTEKNKALMLELMNDKTSDYALVNRKNTLAKDYVPELTGSGNVQMRPVAAAALDEMLAAAKDDGMVLNKKSGYRSYERQVSLYGNGSNKFRSAPGTSEHQTGLAMDVVNAANALNENLADCAEAKWLADNCWRFGFIIRYTEAKENITGYPAEWWHVRYVGKTIAYELHKTGMAYEEFYARCLAAEPAADNAKEKADSESAADKVEDVMNRADKPMTDKIVK